MSDPPVNLFISFFDKRNFSKAFIFSMITSFLKIKHTLALEI